MSILKILETNTIIRWTWIKIAILWSMHNIQEKKKDYEWKDNKKNDKHEIRWFFKYCFIFIMLVFFFFVEDNGKKFLWKNFSINRRVKLGK